MVFDVTTIPYKVVAKYRSNTVTPMIYPQFLANVGNFFNNAHILVETNDVGGQVVGALHDDFEYENLLKTVTKGRAGFVLGEGQSSKLGVTTSASVKTKGCSNFKSLIETDKLLTTDYDIYVEMTTFTRKNDNVNSSFAAEPGTNDDLVMCMVLFGWCVGSDYWKEMTETNPSNEIYKDKLNEQEDDMPLGFQSFATMNERIMDNTGDLWVVVDENREPELPSWYEDVYKTVNL